MRRPPRATSRSRLRGLVNSRRRATFGLTCTSEVRGRHSTSLTSRGSEEDVGDDMRRTLRRCARPAIAPGSTSATPSKRLRLLIGPWNRRDGVAGPALAGHLQLAYLQRADLD